MNALNSQLGVMLLAAGQGLRFGQDKRQYSIKGHYLIEHSIDKYRALNVPLFVVLRESDQRLANHLKHQYPDIHILFSQHAHQGMGHSLADAITLIEKKPHITKLLIALADMPYIQLQTLEALIKTLNAHSLVVPLYQGTMGHPVGFDRCFFKELKLLAGDKGAKAILMRHAKELMKVSVDDIGVLKDIDTKADIK